VKNAHKDDISLYNVILKYIRSENNVNTKRWLNSKLTVNNHTAYAYVSVYKRSVYTYGNFYVNLRIEIYKEQVYNYFRLKHHQGERNGRKR